MVTSCIHGNNWMLVSDRAQELENLPPTTYYTVDSKMYIIRTGIKYHLSAKSEVITGKSQTEVITSRWSLSFSRNDWVDEVNKLSLICKNFGSNFQHPVASLLGHSRSCSVNWNKPVDAIETTRHSFFDNGTIFVFITSRSRPNLTTLKKIHNACSLQENLAGSAASQRAHTTVALYNVINIKVRLILRVVSAL